jgi:hypothetical protein
LRAGKPPSLPRATRSGRSSATVILMDRDRRIAADLQTLRALCDEATSREERLAFLQSLSQRDFLEPEHQVVFESISILLQRGRISLPQLRVDLNNRGFPDVDAENYFPQARTRRGGDESPDKAAL